MVFCNNAAIASDGTVWFSDSSTTYGIEHWKHDFVQDTRTGRLLRRDPDGTITTVLDGLAFANGVALAADESYVAVAETGAAPSSATGSPASGPAPATSWSPDLPGYPDNIARGSDGLIWVTIASPPDALAERLQQRPDVAAPDRRPGSRRGSSRSPSRRVPGPGLRRRRHGSCTTSTCRTTTTTWSPASGSTTAGSGWAASTSRRSPSSTLLSPYTR